MSHIIIFYYHSLFFHPDEYKALWRRLNEYNFTDMPFQSKQVFFGDDFFFPSILSLIQQEVMFAYAYVYV